MNVIFEFVVSKLVLILETRPKPYNITQISKCTNGTMCKHVLMSFSICSTYSDDLYYDVIHMDGTHGNVSKLH